VLGVFVEHGTYTGAWALCVALFAGAATVALGSARLVQRTRG
jgi:hypothetical protein